MPNEEINGDGHWAGMGSDRETGQPILTNSWIDRLAPTASAVLALGTCAAYGGIPAMQNNPTGAMGLRDYLGWQWRSRLGIPVVNLPGCPVQPDNITETLLCLVLHLAGLGPQLDLDEQGRPVSIFGRTVHEGCNRAGFANDGQFAEGHGDGRCLVKLGCAGPVVKCNVPIRGWVNGIGGCPNVGGICMACTMPGFPDKYMPFMDAGHRRPRVREDRQVRTRPLRQVPAAAADEAQPRRRAGMAAAWPGADQRVRAALGPPVTGPGAQPLETTPLASRFLAHESTVDIDFSIVWRYTVHLPAAPRRVPCEASFTRGVEPSCSRPSV